MIRSKTTAIRPPHVHVQSRQGEARHTPPPAEARPVVRNFQVYLTDDMSSRTILAILNQPEPPAVKPHVGTGQKSCCANQSYQAYIARNPDTYKYWAESNQLSARASVTVLLCQCPSCCREIIESMTEAIKTAGWDDDLPHAYRAKAHWLLGNDEQALQDAREAVSRSLYSWFGNAVLGMVLCKRGQHAEALPMLQRASQLSYPNDEIGGALAKCIDALATISPKSNAKSA